MPLSWSPLEDFEYALLPPPSPRTPCLRRHTPNPTSSTKLTTSSCIVRAAHLIDGRSGKVRGDIAMLGEDE